MGWAKNLPSQIEYNFNVGRSYKNDTIAEVEFRCHTTSAFRIYFGG